MTDLKQNKITSREYWKEAVYNLKSTKMIVYAAVIIALRIAVKAFRIPLAAGLEISFDCYVNALGSFIYGPVMGLCVGAVSDTLGCILFPSGAYFFPYIFVEMSSSFIFALFFWNRKITVYRTILSKFTVNFFCNIILTSLCTKWWYLSIGDAGSYHLINLIRIGKNLVIFPIEAILISFVLQAAIPALKKLNLINKDYETYKIKPLHIIVTIILVALAIALILLYIFFLKEFISTHNFSIL